MATATLRPRGGTLDERLAAAGEGLAPAERRVAAYIAEHREEAAFLSAADIAEALGTSSATVVRSAQSLGYAGFPELKEELRHAVRSRSTPLARLGRSLDQLGDDSDAVLDGVLRLTSELVAEARKTIQPADFRRAIDLLRGSERIVVVGLGPNGRFAETFAQTVRRFGRRGLAVISRGAGLADDLLELGRGDVLVLIAHDRVTDEVAVTLDVARERHVPVILITDVLGVALEGRYEVALAARRGTAETYPLTGITLVVVEALLVGLAARDRARTLSSLEELAELRERLGS